MKFAANLPILLLLSAIVDKRDGEEAAPVIVLSCFRS